jgi:hypothetical protein
MPAYLPLPEGLEVPPEGQFELPVLAEMREGQIYVLEIGGMPLPDVEAEMEEELDNAEMNEEDFMAAVERQMGPKR